MAFPEGWGYYKEYDQPGTADGEQTDYQVNITVTHVTDKMLGDFGDVRFTLTDNTELDYHLLSYTASTSAVFVVKIPTLPTGGVTLRVWYGNPDATTTSDPESVYDFYDDFNDGSLDLSKWTWIRESIGNWDEGVTEAGKLNIKTQNTEIYGTANNAAVLRTNQQFTDNFIAECTLKLTPTANFQRGMLIIYTNDNKHIGIGRIYNSYQGGRKLIVQNEIDGTTSEYYTNGDVNELKVKISKLGTDYLCYYDIGANWVLFQTRTNNSITNPYISLVSQSYSRGGGGLNVFYDDVKVYKTTANPPATGSFGSEINPLHIGNAVASGLPLDMYFVPTGEAVATGLPVNITNWELLNIGNATASGLEIEKWFAYTPSFFIENEDGIILTELSFESLHPGKKSVVKKLTAVNNLESEMVMTLTPAESLNQIGDSLDTYLSQYHSIDNINYSNSPLTLAIPALGELDFYTYWQPPSTGKIGWKQWLYDLDLEGVPSLEGWGYVSWFQVTGTGVAIEDPYTLDELIKIDYVHGLMEYDFKDIRFALEDHTVLGYDLISKVDGDHAYFVVQLPEIPASPNNTIVYVYCGNPDAEDESDPTIHQLHNTFQGTSLNPNTWLLNAVGNITYTVNNYLKITNCYSNFDTSWITGLTTDTGNQHQQKVWKVKSEFNIEWQSTLSTAGLDRGQGGIGLIRSDNTLIIWGGHEDIDYPTAVRWLSFYNTEGVWTNVASGWTGDGTKKLTKQENGTKIFNLERDGNSISAYVGGVKVGETTISSTISQIAVVAGRVQGGFSGFVPYIQLDYLCEDEFAGLNLPIPEVGEVEPVWINIYPLPVKADILYQSCDLPDLISERRFAVKLGDNLYE